MINKNMSKKGQGLSINMIILIAIALLILVIIIILVARAGNDVQSSTECVKRGGICKTDCGTNPVIQGDYCNIGVCCSAIKYN